MQIAEAPPVPTSNSVTDMPPDIAPPVQVAEAPPVPTSNPVTNMLPDITPEPISTDDALALVGYHPAEAAMMPGMWFHRMIKELAGSDYDKYLDSLSFAGEVRTNGSYVLGIGCKEHSCGSDKSAFAIDLNSGRLIIMYMENGSLVWVKGAENGNAPSTLCGALVSESPFFCR